MPVQTNISGNPEPKKPVRPEKDKMKNYESEPSSDAEINPNKLDREQFNLDEEGADNSKGHQPYEFKKQDETTGSTNPKEGVLIGQGGYGTSGTNGSNSGGKQGYQSGLGSAGFQNGSTGYNAGSQGMVPNKNKLH